MQVELEHYHDCSCLSSRAAGRLNAEASGVPPVNRSTFWDNFIPRYVGSKDDSQTGKGRRHSYEASAGLGFTRSRQVGFRRATAHRGISIFDLFVKKVSLNINSAGPPPETVAYQSWREELVPVRLGDDGRAPN